MFNKLLHTVMASQGHATITSSNVSLHNLQTSQSANEVLHDESLTMISDEELPFKTFKGKLDRHQWYYPIHAVTLTNSFANSDRQRTIKHATIFSVVAIFIGLSVGIPTGYITSASYFSFSPGYDFHIGGWRFSTPDCQGGRPISNGGWTFTGINLPYGTMTFGQAKAVDLAWDWIVGRGGQALLTFLSYRVFTDALMRAAETHYIPYETFTSLALFSTKIDALWQLTKGLLRVPAWRVRLMMTWLIISTAYLASFPSLIEIMSGYEAFTTTQLNLPNNTTVTNLRSFAQNFSITYNNTYYDYIFPITTINFQGHPTNISERLPDWKDEILNTSWHQTFPVSFKKASFLKIH